MAFDVGKCGSYAITQLGEYVIGFAGIIFVFKIMQFLDAVCGLACSEVFNLSRFSGFIFLFYFI